MSTTTINLGLLKPELTDPADITQMNQNWDKIDTELNNKAPAGYGYGERAESVGRFTTEEEMNTALSNVVNSMGDYETKQILLVDAIAGEYSCAATVYRHSSLYALVEVRRYADGAIYNKKLKGGTWEALEWVTPPMELGKEYRTTERIGGKVVYKKNVDGVIQYRLDGETEWKNQNGLVGAAPSGYGLGEHIAMIVRDVNNATRRGWFLAEPGATNSPNSTYYVAVRSDGVDGNSLVQTAYVLDSYFSKLVRRKTFGTWGAWEYENPPMALGVEYRTTERYYGKAVYCKAINFGALPNATTISVSHNIPATNILRYSGNLNDGKALPYCYSANARIDLGVTKTHISIVTNTNFSDNTATVVLYYTKD